MRFPLYAKILLWFFLNLVLLAAGVYLFARVQFRLGLDSLLAGRADMTFGSRFAGLSDPRGGGMPMYRYLGNRVTTTLENLMLGSRFTELHSGLRAYTRRCLLSLPFLRYSDDFLFDNQMLGQIIWLDFKIGEVTCPAKYLPEGSSINFRRSVRYGLGCLGTALRFRLARWGLLGPPV